MPPDVLPAGVHVIRALLDSKMQLSMTTSATAEAEASLSVLLEMAEDGAKVAAMERAPTRASVQLVKLHDEIFMVAMPPPSLSLMLTLITKADAVQSAKAKP